MRLWTIQPETIYALLNSQKVIHCVPLKSVLLTECEFGSSYDWMAAQMKIRIGNPPDGVRYPIWAWHTVDWKHQKPDLRKTEFRNYEGNQVCIELEIPDKNVLLSDEEMWHFILNDSFIGDSVNKEEFDAENNWFDELLQPQQKVVKEKSWEKIFDVSTPIDTEWNRRGMFMQATFWELNFDHVIDIRNFKGRK
jgi:hypothetical protein